MNSNHIQPFEMWVPWFISSQTSSFALSGPDLQMTMVFDLPSYLLPWLKLKKKLLLNRIDNMVVTLLEQQQVCTNTTVKFVIKWELGDLSFQNSYPFHELQLPLRTPKKMHFPGAIGKIIFISCNKWQQLNLGSVVLTAL